MSLASLDQCNVVFLWYGVKGACVSYWESKAHLSTGRSEVTEHTSWWMVFDLALINTLSGLKLITNFWPDSSEHAC